MRLFIGQGELANEVVDQRRDIVAALAQRRQFDVEDIEPVEKVGAELALLDQLFQILVGGGDAAEVHLDDLVAAHARDLALLQNAQQIGLRLQADVANFVEENRSAFGNFELAFLAVLRAGERAFLVSEEFALEQRLGQRAAVNGDQRMESSRAGMVDRARHQFLAGAAFARDQHGRVGRTNGLNGLENLAHGPALADDVAGTRDFGNGLAQ